MGADIINNRPKISYTKPYLTGQEVKEISNCLTNRKLSGGGEYSKRAESKLSEITKVEGTYLTNSCTEGLEMAYLLCDFKPGDEIIMPSFNFTSAAAVALSLGLVPVFADIDSETLNLDPKSVEKVLTKKTKGIIPIHYAGVPAKIKELKDLAESQNAFLIEDNAHSLGTVIYGTPAGAFSHCSTLSFHATKNIQCGEGGALQSSDSNILERGHVVREKGTNRRKFLDGQIDKYTWVDLGGSFLPNEYTAAFLCAQLDAYSEITEKRKSIWQKYKLK